MQSKHVVTKLTKLSSTSIRQFTGAQSKQKLTKNKTHSMALNLTNTPKTLKFTIPPYGLLDFTVSSSPIKFKVICFYYLLVTLSQT